MKHIKNLVTHHRPHLDEIVAGWILRNYGETSFVGIKNAKLVILEKELEQTYSDDIYIGVGGDIRNPYGVIFDEHTSEGRLPDTCAALMVARFLDVDRNEALQKLLGEVLWCDSEPKVLPTQLANLVKAMYRVAGCKEQERTVLWAEDAIQAIVFGKQDVRFDLLGEWTEYMIQERLNGRDSAVRHVNKCITEILSRNEKFITDIDFIASRIDRGIRRAWLNKLFGVLVDDAYMYQSALQSRYDSYDINTGKATELMIVIKSDNEHALRAASSSFFGKSSITVIRNSKGHTVISGNPTKKDMRFEEMFALIRMAEFKARTGGLLPYWKARQEGVTKECPEWCMPFKNTFLNGSLTHPWTVPSLLTVDSIVEIANHAFTQRGCEDWIANYEGREVSIPIETVINLGMVLDVANQKKIAC